MAASSCFRSSQGPLKYKLSKPHELLLWVIFPSVLSPDCRFPKKVHKIDLISLVSSVKLSQNPEAVTSHMMLCEQDGRTHFWLMRTKPHIPTAQGALDKYTGVHDLTAAFLSQLTPA
jgi:hypothetical protein